MFIGRRQKERIKLDDNVPAKYNDLYDDRESYRFKNPTKFRRRERKRTRISLLDNENSGKRRKVNTTITENNYMNNQIGGKMKKLASKMLKPIDSVLRDLVMDKITKYLGRIMEPEIRFAEFVAGLTTKNLNYFVRKPPRDVSELIRAYNISSNYRSLFIIYYDLFETIFEEISHVQKIHKIKKYEKVIGKVETEVPKEIIQDDYKDALIKIKEELDYLKKSVQYVKLGPKKESDDLLRIIREFDNPQKKSISQFEEVEEGETGMVQAKIGAFSRIKKKFSQMKKRNGELCPYSRCSNTFSDILNDIQLISPKISLNMDVDDDDGEEESVYNFDEDELMKKTQNIVSKHLKRLTSETKPDKMSMWQDIDMSIQFNEKYTSSLVSALELVRKSIGSSGITTSKLIRNDLTHTHFGWLVAEFIKEERFDHSTRIPGGKYHAERAFERYPEKINSILDWFDNNVRYSNGKIINAELDDSSRSEYLGRYIFSSIQ